VKLRTVRNIICSAELCPVQD